MAAKSPNRRLVTLGLIAALTFLAWHNRFIQDDAFIAFRYADHLVQGWGPVWNPGERVEGYTDFLWVMLLGIGSALRLEPVAYAQGLGLALFAATLWFTCRLARLALASLPLAWLTIVLLGTNYTFSSYATGGMETQLQTCFWVAAFYLVCATAAKGIWTAARLTGVSLLLAGALLTRLDSALVAGLLLAATFYLARRAGLPARRWGLLLLLPLTVIVGGWLAWKLWFYGTILPNTYYVKVAAGASFRQGWIYLYEFFCSYWLWPFALSLLFLWRRPAVEAAPALVLPAGAIVLWLLYVVRVGGDFMEFRFFVPILPFFFILLVWLIFRRLSLWRPLALGLCAVILAGSLWHARTFETRSGIESIASLDSVGGGARNWVKAGQALGQAFADTEGPLIAVTAGGAIPYYSRLPTVDMLGLNDAWVAQNGAFAIDRPGHYRISPYSYLLERGVNLVIGFPQIVPHDAAPEDIAARAGHFISAIPGGPQIPATAQLLTLPIDSDNDLLVLYLLPQPSVDEARQRAGWRTYPLHTTAGKP